MDYMYNACSTTARRGALDWAPIFEKANLPIFEKLYESVKNGTETRKSLEFNGRSTYREDLAKELKEINDQEIWRAGTHLPLAVSPVLMLNVYLCRQDRAVTASGLQARVGDLRKSKSKSTYRATWTAQVVSVYLLAMKKRCTTGCPLSRTRQFH
jgi:hypothetical protein